MILKTSKLGDACKIQSGNSIPAKEKDELFRNAKNGLPYVATKDISYTGSINFQNGIRIPPKFSNRFKLSEKNSVLICAEGGSAGRKIAYSNKDCHFVNKLFSIKPKSEIDVKYIYYYTLSDEFQKKFKKSMRGLIGGVSLSKIKSFQITYPSLREQQRIVAKLDAAFAEVDNSVLVNKSKLTNQKTIEKKITNKLILENGSDFIKKPIHSLFNLSSGKFLPRKKMNHNGKIKVYGGNGISGYHDTFNLEDENILIGRVGEQCGNVYYTNEKIWLTDNCLHINSYKYDFDKQFLSMLLSNLNIRTYAHQAAQPAISYTSLKDIELIFPKSIHEQTIIFKKYIDLKSSFNNLNNNYESQMMSLKKLKLSIFNKAIFNEAA